MSAIGYLTELLDQIPIWKRLNALFTQLEELSARVTALEDEVRKRPPIEQCLICETGTLKVIKIAPHPEFGRAGIQERTLKCDNPACNHLQLRMYDPIAINRS